MKLKTFLLSTCVLCSLSTIGFSATDSRDEFKGYVDNHKKLIERVKRAASQGGIDEYAQYRDEFLVHTKEYATLKLSNGGAVLNNANSAKKILHIMISTATKHYLTELSIRHDRDGFYTNYIYSIAQALHTLSDAEYGQILALIDSEITRCEPNLLAQKQLRILKGVIEEVKAKLIDISTKRESRQRLVTYHEYEKKMIAIIAREEARKETESRLARDRSSLFGARDEELSSRTSAAAVDLSLYVLQEEHERVKKEAEKLRRQSGAGGGVVSPIRQLLNSIIEEVGNNNKLIREKIKSISDQTTRKRVLKEFETAYMEERVSNEIHLFIKYLEELMLAGEVNYSDIIKTHISIFEDITSYNDVDITESQSFIYYNRLIDLQIRLITTKMNRSTGVWESGEYEKLAEAISKCTEDFDSSQNLGISAMMTRVANLKRKERLVKQLRSLEGGYGEVLSNVNESIQESPLAYLLKLDTDIFYEDPSPNGSAQSGAKWKFFNDIKGLMQYERKEILNAIFYHILKDFDSHTEKNPLMENLALTYQSFIEAIKTQKAIPTEITTPEPEKPKSVDEMKFPVNTDLPINKREADVNRRRNEYRIEVIVPYNKEMERRRKYPDYINAVNWAYSSLYRRLKDRTLVKEFNLFKNSFSKFLATKRGYDKVKIQELFNSFEQAAQKAVSPEEERRLRMEDVSGRVQPASDEHSAGGGSGGGAVGKIDRNKLAAPFRQNKAVEKTVVEDAERANSKSKAAAVSKLNVLLPGGGAVPKPNPLAVVAPAAGGGMGAADY